MNLALLRTWSQSQARLEKAGLAVWAVILLFVCVRAFISPESKTVYPIFSASGQFWWSGIDLYEPYRPTDVQEGYRYSPTFAVLVTPFALLPDSIGGVLWRLFNAGSLLWALGWLTRAVLPSPVSTKHYAMLLLLVVPLTLQSLNNGQANLIVIAAMLAAVAAVKEERWNLAAALLAFSFIIKLYPLALGMVLIVLYPRHLSWRCLVAVVTSMLLPFFCQSPEYVADQFAKWIVLLRSEDRSDIQLEHMYRDLWLLIHLYGVPIGRPVYTILQALAGAGVAVLCWRRQRTGWSSPALLMSTLALVTAWMMLLGPATESSSFVLLAPSLAWSVLQALQTPGMTWQRFLLWASCACFALAVFTGAFSSTVKAHGMGVHAWGSLFYFAYLLTPQREPGVQTSGARVIRIRYEESAC